MKFEWKQKPVVGDKRSRHKFAWLPTRMDNGTMTVWLERYHVEEQFMAYRVPTKYGVAIWTAGWIIMGRAPLYPIW